MPASYFPMDVNFADHPKIVGLSDAAFRVWTASIAYANRLLTDGFIAQAIIHRFHDCDWQDADDTPQVHAAELVTAGLWHAVEGGYQIHDFGDHNRTRDERMATRDKERARKATYRRDQRNKGRDSDDGTPDGRDAGVPAGQDGGVPADASVRGTVNTETETETETEQHSPGGGGSGGNPAPGVGTQAADTTSATLHTGTDPGSKTVFPGQASARTVTGSNEAAGPAPKRKRSLASSSDERIAQQLCDLLADEIEAWAGERPTVRKAWHTAARLLLTKDGYSVERVTQLISFATSSEFWRSNILSMPKLREKRLTLLGQLQRARASPNGVAAPTSAADRHAATRAQTSADLDAWAAQAEAETHAAGGDKPP